MSTGPDALKGLRSECRSEAMPEPRRGLWLASAALLATVLALALWGWLSLPTAAPVQVATVHDAGSIAAGAVVNATGYVTARRQAAVFSKAAGMVLELWIRKGMVVQGGQLLAHLDAKTQTAALSRAEAQLAQARSALEQEELRRRQAGTTRQRQQRLLAGGAGTENGDAAEPEAADSLAARQAFGLLGLVESTSREVEARRQDVDDTFIRAPLTGVITTLDAQAGMMIVPISAGAGSTRICTVVDMASIEVEADVDDSFVNRVYSGQHAMAVLDAYPDWRIPATVMAVGPSAGRQGGTREVRLRLDHLDARILPDMEVKVAFLAENPLSTAAGPRERATPVLALVPRAALYEDHGQQVAFVLRGDRVERRVVRITTASGYEATVIAGLAPGEQVVVYGPPDLADGRKVVLR
jgi:HlyD family secretion protein